jgi:hypothetical protein
MQTIKNAISALFSSQHRISYRRLAVFCVATGLLAIDMIDAQTWAYIGLAYIAGDSAEKAIAALRK